MLQVLVLIFSINVIFFCITTSGFLVKPPATTLPPLVVTRMEKPVSQRRVSTLLSRAKSPSALSMELNLFSTDNLKKDNKKKSNERNKSPKIVRIESSEDYINFLKEDDRICVIKFHASWCKSCQKMGVMFRHLAMEEGDLCNKKNELVQSGSVRFAEIEFGANTKLCRTLGIKRLPSVHLHKGAVGQLAGFPCGPAKFPSLENTLESFLGKSDEELELDKKLEESSDLSDEIINQLRKDNSEKQRSKTQAVDSTSNRID